jgi:CheY-like chemotaxis protein/anti-sigma regulatory factor (Ser/Thr protein kinase)
VTAVLDAALDVVRPMAEGKSITVTALVAPDVGVIRADADRLQQILWNLLSNAVKFTLPGGRVDVRAFREDDMIRISIRDTGAGIDPEFLPFLFERFRQEDTRTTRIHGGLGLGLAIARHLVELHGGHIRAESAGVGQGSTFTVTLPEHARTDVLPPSGEVAPMAILPPGDIDLHGVRILVVDDDPDIRDFVSLVLDDAGAETERAASTTEALALANTFHPDVLLTDIGMPLQDGYVLLEQWRARERALSLPPTPAIALTAHARSDDRRRALRAGFQSHVAKPVDGEELLATIWGAVSRRDQPSA